MQAFVAMGREGGESLDDTALFFPKALNASFCLAGLLTCPGSGSLPIFAGIPAMTVASFPEP